MTDINEIERRAQNRVVSLIRDELHYEYGGNVQDRANTNIDESRLRAFLQDPIRQACSDALVAKVLHKLHQVANDKTKTLYDRNRSVYDLLKYGVNVLPEVGEQTVTIKLIDWANPLQNDFMVAEEVTVVGPRAVKRPDVVLYVNGIALSVLELKRSTVSVSEGIRQNLDNQRPEFIEHFFSTIQWVMAGNDSQGLRYGTIETPEKYYLTWREDGDEESILDRAILQVCEKTRLLEFIHDFIVFDAGIKKVCRHNQYFGVRASETAVANRAGGIIWHTQGSGKSLTMVWLAQWIREHIADSRVLIVTDRKELDEQIEGVFQGVGAEIYRTTSGTDLIESLNTSNPWLLCSLIHKFANRRSDDNVDEPGYIRELRAALPENFTPKGDIFVFIDECHRSQSNLLHKAMKEILPEAVFIGFTGTPLLKKDKAKSIEIFGPYIHTYKFDEAVRDGVIVDLRYEARDIDQHISDPEAIDRWFAAKTKGLNDIAKAQLKKRWGTMQEVLSSNSRLSRIVSDVVVDMNTRERLASGRGNAILVTASIRDACEIFEQFQKTELKGHCGIITSYAPSISDLKGETTGEGETVTEKQYNVYRQMLADWFKISSDEAMGKVETYEIEAKARFIKEPGQLKLLVVVDKLLTGFDAPPATYLYIDKHMQDHGLFQAICRVNRLDGDDKDYGYIVDYKDLFRSLEGAVLSYTGEAFSGLDAEDVAGLLKDRVAAARAELDDTREAVRSLVEPVTLPRSQAEYRHYFCTTAEGDASQLQSNEPKRLAFYKAVGAFLRAFANVANDYTAAGYSDAEIDTLRK
jgi:type I restriction enzyme R subunit